MTDYDPRRPLLQPNEVAVFHGLFEVESRFKIKQSYSETESHSTMRRHAIACIQKYSDCPVFDAFTPYLAMNYYDRFLSDHSLPNENELEFASKDLMKMELHILNTLKWRMRSLTPICFAIFFFSQLKPTREQLKTRPVFIIIIRSQNNIAFTQFRPSIVAASAVLKHLSNVSPEQLDDFKETSCTFVPADELTLCLEEMEKWYKIQFGDGGGGGGPPEKRLSATIDIPGARSGAGSSSAAGGGGGGADSLETLLDAARPSIAFGGQRPGKDTVAEEDKDVEEKKKEEEDLLSSSTSASGDASPAASGRRPGKEPVVEEEKKEKAAKEEIKEAEEEFLMNFPLEWTSDDIKKTAKALSKGGFAGITQCCDIL
ncbi:uncharacterized protein LOC132278372 [Cornus florida]|uniref:uncharacterized protein LOC132278372 n=1 Tax=Cornus florida TaxID=4283 RepID=UPI0028A0A405|nr:uncharacterized protein LOC132278372 [Cornus florida]